MTVPRLPASADVRPALPPAMIARRHKLPSWLDVRLITGVALVLFSVLIGAKIIATADHSAQMWMVRNPLSAGVTLDRGDLALTRVQLFDMSGKYLPAQSTVVGRTLLRDLGAGELLPKDAIRPAPCGSLISVPITAHHLPSALQKGQRIDLFASGERNGETETVRVLASAAVQSINRPRSGLLAANAQWSLSLRVPTEQTQQVVHALRAAEIDVALVVEQARDVPRLCEDPKAESPPHIPEADREQPTDKPSNAPQQPAPSSRQTSRSSGRAT